MPRSQTSLCADLALFLCKSFIAGKLRYSYDSRIAGHSDLRTTMIYTHTVQSVTLKEAKSPLDF